MIYDMYGLWFINRIMSVNLFNFNNSNKLKDVVNVFNELMSKIVLDLMNIIKKDKFVNMEVVFRYIHTFR